MAADDDVPVDLDALADDQVTDLFGWPVRLLDQLRELHQRAHRENIGIREWRHQDAELRGSGPKRYPREEVKAARDAALDAWVSTPASEKETTGRRMLRLAERLGAALEGPPDDEGLREQLTQIDGMLKSERMRGVQARLQEDRDQVTRWLAASAGLDEATGLPWDYLARYRWLPDPVLGDVPAFIELARKRALAEAGEETALLARQVRPDAKPDPMAISELNQHALTLFPRRIFEAASHGDADAISGQVTNLWQAPEMQRFLLRETAKGWPESLRQPDRLPQ